MEKQLRVSDKTHQAVKILAFNNGETMYDLVERILTEYLELE